MIRLLQFVAPDGGRRAGLMSADSTLVSVLDGVTRVYDLAREAIQADMKLDAIINRRVGAEQFEVAELLAERRVLPPIDHPDPAHCWVTGTGLTHLGSASARDRMHTERRVDAAPETDTMRLFRLGVDGGKPSDGICGVQPEWFYKGNGHCIVAPEHAFESPTFAKDSGEEPELVGIYVVGETKQPFRLGFALGNELSDHVIERENYLYLAHSKLRPCAIGPELVIGELPADIRGRSRIVRDGEVLWEDEFLTGEANMSHSISNLEHHHFKYDLFRIPGDVHCHFMGTATLSFAAGITTKPGDVFEIEAPHFGLPLRNPLACAAQVDTRVCAL